MPDKVYRTAIYCRLSREDGDKVESNSIASQRAICEDYIARHEDLELVCEPFVDDGYSGVSFNRPQFKKLEEAIRKGALDCIVVKDLSRFSRNYIDGGRYIEKIFPQLGIPAQIGRNLCDQLFAAEKEIQRLPPEQRQEKRLAVEQPMLRAFWCWLDELSTQPLAGSLKKAVEYAQGQRSYMENYLKDPRYEISNNRAENKIHPFTVGRKNWLFSDTPAGAKASAVIYSIVETAKANNLAPRDYIQFLFENLPDMEIQTHPERLDQMLPWGKLIQENFA